MGSIHGHGSPMGFLRKRLKGGLRLTDFLQARYNQSEHAYAFGETIRMLELIRQCLEKCIQLVETDVANYLN